MKRTRADKPKFVLSFTRRSDGVANKDQLDSFLAGLAAGAVTYPHPKFALNPVSVDKPHLKMCTYPVSPDTVAAISWWSKDFKNLIEAWSDTEPDGVASLLARYKHHFSFAINGAERTILEPGVASTFEERIEQLRWLVNKCIDMGQDPNASILVKVDPISVYSLVPADGDAAVDVRDTLAHIPMLCEYLKAFGLSRLHISFTQFNFPATKSRLRKLSNRFVIRELEPAEQRALLEAKLFPYTKAAGIQVQTCTAMDTVNFYRAITETALSTMGIGPAPPIVQGACVGWREIASITNGACKMAFTDTKGKSATRYCACYPHRDVGDKSKACTHGCRVCFSNPQAYDF